MKPRPELGAFNVTAFYMLSPNYSRVRVKQTLLVNAKARVLRLKPTWPFSNKYSISRRPWWCHSYRATLMTSMTSDIRKLDQRAASKMPAGTRCLSRVAVPVAKVKNNRTQSSRIIADFQHSEMSRATGPLPFGSERRTSPTRRPSNLI